MVRTTPHGCGGDGLHGLLHVHRRTLAILHLRHLMPDTPRSIRAGPSVAGYPIAPILGLLATIVMLVFLDPTTWDVDVALIAVALIV